MIMTMLAMLFVTPETNLVSERLASDVRALVNDHGLRDAEHPENLQRIATWLGQRFAKAGASATREQRYTVDGHEYVNVIAAFGPSTADKLIVGAHYDTAGPLPGADDNASGVAVLLELARRLGEKPPATRVELVAWTLEEPPHFATKSMGSRVHARSLAAENARVRAVVALEMLGCYDDKAGSQTYPDPSLAARFGDKGDFLAVVGRPEDMAILTKFTASFGRELRVETLAAPAELTGISFSDHASYWPHGFNGVMLTDTAFFRNPRYHTREDTPDTLDYRRMALAADGVERSVRALAEGTQ